MERGSFSKWRSRIGAADARLKHLQRPRGWRAAIVFITQWQEAVAPEGSSCRASSSYFPRSPPYLPSSFSSLFSFSFSSPVSSLHLLLLHVFRLLQTTSSPSSVSSSSSSALLTRMHYSTRIAASAQAKRMLLRKSATTFAPATNFWDSVPPPRHPDAAHVATCA